MFKINKFTNLPQRAICALINEKKKKMYIFYSISVYMSLFTHIKKCKYKTYLNKEMNEDVDNLTFKIIETFDDYSSDLVGRYCVKVYADKMGYALYNRIPHINIKYKVIMLPKRVNFNICYRPHVYIINSRGVKFKVKDFSNVLLAQEYIASTSIDEMLRTTFKL